MHGPINLMFLLIWVPWKEHFQSMDKKSFDQIVFVCVCAHARVYVDTQKLYSLHNSFFSICAGGELLWHIMSTLRGHFEALSYNNGEIK